MSRADQVRAALAETLPCPHVVSGADGFVSVVYCDHPDHAELVRRAMDMTSTATGYQLSGWDETTGTSFIQSGYGNVQFTPHPRWE